MLKEGEGCEFETLREFASEINTSPRIVRRWLRDGVVKGAKVGRRLNHVYSIVDRSTVTPGHILIIPIRQPEDYFEMTEEELDEVDTFILSMREYLLSKDPTITGFNIGMNCGQSAGQSVMHAHFPLIPRRDGDTENPRGGVMGMIPEKMDY